LEKNDEGRLELEDEDDLFKTLISPFCSQKFFTVIMEMKMRCPDDIKEWEILDDLEENIQSGKYRIPAFVKLVFKWE
jgi:hypothetical protein